MSKHPKPNNPNAPVWNMNEDQPYARRSVSSIFNVIIISVVGALGLYWVLGIGQGQSETGQYPAQGSSDIDIPNAGLEDLAEEAVSLVTGVTTNTTAGQAAQLLERQAEALAQLMPQYENSVRDIINSDVITHDGNNAGKIHDILINKETGEARAVVVNDLSGKYYSNDLKKLSFTKVIDQKADGTIKTSITAETLESNPQFDYDEKDEKFISLRNLRNAQILDDTGKVAGEVIAVIYQDEETQSLYFSLSPTLAPEKEDRKFGIPYEAVNLVKGDDGYNIQLTKAQTAELASRLF